MLPMPSHSTVESEAIISSDGFVVSSIVNVAVVELALPQSSVAVNVTVADPVAPAIVAQGIVVVAPGNTAASIRSVAPPLLASQSFNSIMLHFCNTL